MKTNFRECIPEGAIGYQHAPLLALGNDLSVAGSNSVTALAGTVVSQRAENVSSIWSTSSFIASS